MTRRVFRQFTKTECDDMAAFLISMAKEGWHFKEWKLGFVFEKGEPEDVEYAVEIFIKGSQWDLKPDKDTEEFAEYCKEAGWEFVDYSKKFLIFKKIKEDAEDIVTAKEHFENAAKEELKSAYLQIAGYILIMCLNLKNGLIDSFYYNIFNNEFLIISVLFLGYIIYSVFYAVKITLWYFKNRRIVADGNKIYLGIGVEKQRKKYWRWIMIIVFIEIVLFYCLINVKGIQSGFGLLIFGVIFLSCLYGLEYIRPSKTGYILSVVAIAFLIPTIFAFTMLTYSDEENVYQDKSLAPLLQEDYRTVDLPFEDIQIDKTENFLGGYVSYRVTYHKYNENEADEKWDEIDYTIIKSKYEWILERSWKLLIEKEWGSQYYECTDVWKSEYAIKYVDWFDSYYVRYNNQIFVLRFEPTLSNEQIKLIIDKLNLGQVM